MKKWIQYIVEKISYVAI